jgi:hypothetical protein
VGEGLFYRGQPFVLLHWSELEFFDWGIRLQAGPILKRLGQCYEFRYEELAEAIRDQWMLARGVVFRTKIPLQPPMFLTVDGREILNRLEHRGVPVNHNWYD